MSFSATILILYICSRKQQNNYFVPNVQENIQEDLEFRKEYINKCMENMRRDEYKNIRAKFEQNNCII